MPDPVDMVEYFKVQARKRFQHYFLFAVLIKRGELNQALYKLLMASIHVILTVKVANPAGCFQLIL